MLYGDHLEVLMLHTAHLPSTIPQHARSADRASAKGGEDVTAHTILPFSHDTMHTAAFYLCILFLSSFSPTLSYCRLLDVLERAWQRHRCSALALRSGSARRHFSIHRAFPLVPTHPRRYHKTPPGTCSRHRHGVCSFSGFGSFVVVVVVVVGAPVAHRRPLRGSPRRRRCRMPCRRHVPRRTTTSTTSRCVRANAGADACCAAGDRAP